jgi:hypothetical protein
MLLALALLSACVSVEGTAPIFPSTDDTEDPPGVTPTDTDDPDPLGDAPLRPLCKRPLEPPAPQRDIVAWAAGVLSGTNPFVGNARWYVLESMGEHLLGDTDELIVSNQIERGWERLRVGDVDAAILDLEAAVKLAEDRVPLLRGRAREVLALAWYRKGEVDNCAENPNGQACLIPVNEWGRHVNREGMERAVEVLTTFLREDDPDHLMSRWMLNVAHMTLGSWPDGVEARWRITAEQLASDWDMPQWTNVTPAIGINRAELAGGASIDDYDGDGQLDLLMSSVHPNGGFRLYLNQGDGTWCDASEGSGLSVVTGALGVSPADFDNDGDLDILATRGAWYQLTGNIRPSLMQNDGTGRFTDITFEAGMTNVIGPSQTAAWADVNGDGLLDVFVGREQSGDYAENIADSSLYMNNGDGTFVDVAQQAGLAYPGYVKGASFGDFDNDGDPDLYVNVMAGSNRLYLNDRRSGTFIDMTDRFGVAAPEKGFSTWWFDYNQDGRLDILAIGYPTTYAVRGPTTPEYGHASDGWLRDVLGMEQTEDTTHLYENTGTEFVDVTAAVGLDHVHATMGANFGDLDADGFPDMYYGTGSAAYDGLEPNVAWKNEAGLRFHDVTTATGTGHLQKGHGVAFGDIDEDGDEDLLADMGGAFPGDRFPDAMFINPTNTVGGGHFAVTLKLEGVTVNRSAVGARVRVVTPSRTFHHVLNTGGSFGCNTHQIEAGLGEEDTIERVEIDWPDGPSETFTGITPGSIYEIREGEGVVSSRPFGYLAIPVPDLDHGHEN